MSKYFCLTSLLGESNLDDNAETRKLLNHLRTSIDAAGPTFDTPKDKKAALKLIESRIKMQAIAILAESASYDALVAVHNYTQSCAIAGCGQHPQHASERCDGVVGNGQGGSGKNGEGSGQSMETDA